MTYDLGRANSIQKKSFSTRPETIDGFKDPYRYRQQSEDIDTKNKSKFHL